MYVAREGLAFDSGSKRHVRTHEGVAVVGARTREADASRRSVAPGHLRAQAPCPRVNVDGEPGAYRKAHAGFGEGYPETDPALSRARRRVPILRANDGEGLR
jgi:hypothetical protein